MLAQQRQRDERQRPTSTGATAHEGRRPREVHRGVLVLALASYGVMLALMWLAFVRSELGVQFNGVTEFATVGGLRPFLPRRDRSSDGDCP